MRSPTFKTKHRSYKNVSPEIQLQTVEAVSFELYRTLYLHNQQRAALEDAIEHGKNVSFKIIDFLEFAELYFKLTGLYLTPKKPTIERERLKLIETEAQRIADETNAPLWITRFMLRQMMDKFI